MFENFLRIKLDDLHGELDASMQTNKFFRGRHEENEKKREKLIIEINEKQFNLQQINDEKTFLQSEVERLKGYF